MGMMMPVMVVPVMVMMPSRLRDTNGRRQACHRKHNRNCEFLHNNFLDDVSAHQD
jgi:hypothetical protein